ncbi:lipid II flippase MurJ [Actinotalea sp. AC32]|nr:lipid II flippase MurJ [Actinotalea sp. AC32]
MGPALTPASRSWARGLVGAAAVIALVTVASRVAGFARSVVQSDAVGATGLGAVYNSANMLPNVLFEVVAGGALAGAVVPLLAAPLARRVGADVDRIASALLGWALVVLVPLAAVLALLARPIASLVLQSSDPARVALAADFLVAFAPQVPLYGVGVVLTGVLQAHRRFVAPAAAPLLSSAVVIGVFAVFDRMVLDPGDLGSVSAGEAALLAWGTTAGVAALSLPLLWPVHRCGVRLRPTLTFPPGVARRARALAGAGVGALLAQQASVLAALLLANRYGGDAYAVVPLLQAVYVLPYAVLAVPLATAAFPRLAERASQGDRPGFARLASTTTRGVLVVSALGATVLVAAAPAVEQFFRLYGEGDFTGMGPGLAWNAPGLVGFALVLHLSRTLYALERGRAAMAATVAGWLVVVGVAVVLVPALAGPSADQPATLAGLGVANTVGMTVAGVGLLVAVSRSAGRSAVHGVVRTAAVLLVGGAGGGLAGRLVGDEVLSRAGEGIGEAVAAGALAAVAAGVVVLALALLVDRHSVLAVMRRTRPADGRARPVPEGR